MFFLSLTSAVLVIGCDDLESPVIDDESATGEIQDSETGTGNSNGTNAGRDTDSDKGKDSSLGGRDENGNGNL